MKIKICGVFIDKLSFYQVVERIANHISYDRTPVYVVTPNAQHINLFQKDDEFKKIYHDAFMSVPDGVPLLWAARLMSNPLKGRVNGTDLVEKLCELAEKEQLKIFFLGGRPKAANEAAQILCDRYPKLKPIDTYCPPYNFENNLSENNKIKQIIKLAAPDILFVGLGAPKQEKWIRKNYQQLDVPVSIGIGGSFELISGYVSRAPKWMQNVGLEWLFRLIKEPRRLWKRYLVGNLIFVYLVLRQKISSMVIKKNRL